MFLKASVPDTPDLDPQSLCPVDGPRSMTIVLVDATDELPMITRVEIVGYLSDIAEALPRYGLLELRMLDPVRTFGNVVFSKCNPGDGSGLSHWDANPVLARRNWLSEFRDPLDAALNENLTPSEADTSPILQTIQAISVERFFDDGNADTPKHLIIVSDMIENAQGYSQYSGDLSYERFRTSSAYERLRTNLHGAEVTIRYVQRLGPDIDSGEHIEFWLRWIEDNGGTIGEISKLVGAG